MNDDEGSPLHDKEMEEIEDMDDKIQEMKEDAIDDADSETQGTLEDELKIEYNTHKETKETHDDDEDDEDDDEGDEGVASNIVQTPGTGMSGMMSALERRMQERESGPNDDNSLDEMFGTDEATAKCLSELVHYRRINLLTNLDRETIASLTINNALGNHIARGLPSTLLLDMGQHFKELQVSEDGLGRKQVVSLGSYVGGMAEEKKSRLMGLLANRGGT